MPLPALLLLGCGGVSSIRSKIDSQLFDAQPPFGNLPLGPDPRGRMKGSPTTSRTEALGATPPDLGKYSQPHQLQRVRCAGAITA